MELEVGYGRKFTREFKLRLCGWAVSQADRL